MNPEFFSLARFETTEDKPTRVWLETTFSKPAENSRTVSGTFAPYGVSIVRRSWMLGTHSLQIEHDALATTENAMAFYNHDWETNGLPIGTITETAHAKNGLTGSVKLSQTPKADEVLALCEDGVLTRFSVGMSITSYRVDGADTDNAELVVTAGEVFEVSIVPFPAFDDARITSVNSLKGPLMETETPAPPAVDVVALNAAVDRLSAQVATLGSTPSAAAGATIPFDSYGEYVQALARGDEQAKDLLLAYTGGTIGDLGEVVKDAWLGDLTRWVDQGRTVMSLFDKGALPEAGMGVEYGFLDEDTTSITEQLREGDELDFGEVTFDTARAPIKTYGGYGEMSLQEIERSPIDVVTTLFRALALRYSKVTETVVRGTALNATAKGITADLSDADGWTDFISDAAFHLDDKGLVPEFLLVGRDVWKELAKLRDGTAADAPRLLDRTNGRLNLVGLTGDLYGIPVVPINTGATAGVVRVCNSWAVRSWESGGAPLQLQDGDITNLTKAFSVYGYLASAVIDAEAIVKPLP